MCNALDTVTECVASVRGGSDIALRVERVSTEAVDIVSLDLADPQGAELPPFTAGAHIRLRLANDLVREYSLYGSPADRRTYKIAVKKEADSRGGSRAVHGLRAGDIVFASPPVNNFEVDWGASRLVLLAAGIGITPLLSMAGCAQRRGTPFDLHYFARSAEHAAFRDESFDRCPIGRIHAHFAVPVEGVSERLRRILGQRAPDAQLYICGPGPFMDAAREAASENWPPGAVHWEYFTPPDRPADQDTAGFQVKLAHSGAVFDVPPGKSILDVLRENGVDVPFSCCEGMCGTCVVEVLEGVPDHRDDFLSDEARESGEMIALCVSRSKSPTLLLDL